MEGSSGKEEEASPSSLYEQNSDGSHDHVQRELFSSSRCELLEQERLKENWGSYSRLVDKHRTRMKEALPCLKGKSEESSLEETQSESETRRLWEDTIQDEVAFQKKLHEAELAIGSAEMFLPSFKETLTRISKACYISAADMIKISMQEDLLVMELGALKNMKGLLQQLLRSSKEKEIISIQIEDLIWKLTESETEAVELKNEVLRKERHILELSTQLQHEKANVLKASRHSESTQLVQTHLQCQIERKEAENNQLRTKFKTVEKNITEWKQQVGEYKQQILAEKDRRKERRNGLKKAASVQKQRAELLKAAVESLISKIGEKEIQLSEVLSACNVWKSHHEAVVDEKARLEVQAETLKKQIADHLMELRRLKDVGRRSTNEILGKLNAITSENEKISRENTKLKALFASLEASTVSAEAELVDLREEAQQQENIIEHYKNELGKLELETEELKTRYEKVIHEGKKLMDGKDLEIAIVENDSFLKQLSLEEENRNIQLKYEDVKRKLEETELKNKELENQSASQEECLQETELQFKQKLASYDALTRQLEAALEDGRKKLKEEVEKIASKEQAFQMKILDLENQLRRKKEEQRHLSRRLDAREKHRQMSLKELEHSLQRSENQNQSIQNYVKFLKTSYVTMFG
ncbi:protein BCAP isoform X3 [Zootoca vivipara]|uniref:protein BCAP isoform X3 n=1 Tax=Zootoca vivipara TaxID=8524 RepID=UPI00293BDAE7|nr:protein BCAP isoform X3 [Zootoca vivipara]